MSFVLARRRRRLGAEATPDALTGLVAWGEGSDLGADGSSIASWLNKTGSGLDPAQATGANQPTVVANAINGQKAARFTAASSQTLTFPAGALGSFNGATGATLMAIYQPLSVPAAAQVVHVSVNSSTSGRVAISQLAGTPNVFRSVSRPNDVAATIADSASVSPAIGTPAIHVGIFDGSVGSLTQLVNGRGDPAPAVSLAQSLPSTNSLAIALGSTSLANFCDGYLAAYAMWNVPYTRTQLDGVLRRFARIYGVAIIS